MRVLGWSLRKSDLALNAVPHFVRHQGRATVLRLGKRKHDHCPLRSSPIDRGVGDVDFLRQFPDKDIAVAFELVLSSRLIGENRTRCRIGQQERTAKKDAPKLPAVTTTDRVSFTQSLGGCRRRMGDRCKDQSQPERGCFL